MLHSQVARPPPSCAPSGATATALVGGFRQSARAAARPPFSPTTPRSHGARRRRHRYRRLQGGIFFLLSIPYLPPLMRKFTIHSLLTSPHEKKNHEKKNHESPLPLLRPPPRLRRRRPAAPTCACALPAQQRSASTRRTPEPPRRLPTPRARPRRKGASRVNTT